MTSMDVESSALRELLESIDHLMHKIEQRPRLAAALVDPRKSNEAFYSLLFGDVEEILAHIEDIRLRIDAAGSNAGSHIDAQTARLAEEAERLNQSLKMASGIQSQLQAFANIAVGFKDAAESVKHSNGIASEQLRASANATQCAIIEFDAAGVRLADAISKVENVNLDGVGAHQKTVVALAGIAITVTALIAGAIVGRLSTNVISAEERFATVNDVRTMLRCEAGTLFENRSGKFCVLTAHNRNGQVIAWRVE